MIPSDIMSLANMEVKVGIMVQEAGEALVKAFQTLLRSSAHIWNKA
jgi:hypothetical protein